MPDAELISVWFFYKIKHLFKILIMMDNLCTII